MRHSFYLTTCLGVLLLILVSGARAYAQDDSGHQPFRLAFSARVFADVNEADISAAMKAWIMKVTEDLGIPVDPDIHLQPTLEALVEFSRTHRVDGLVVITPELAELSREIPFDRIAVGVTGGHTGEEYLLLVHRDGGVQRLDQLEGVSINVLDHPRMSLALTWLDTVLLEADLGMASEFFRHVNLDSDASRVVLQVFFRTRMACLVTRTGFEVMAELNPQLKRQLRVLAVSPPLVPNVFAFRADTVSPFRSQILKAIERLNASQAGRQILTLHQSEAVEVHPISIMDDSLALLVEHRRLCDLKNRSLSDSSGTTAEIDHIGEVK